MGRDPSAGGAHPGDAGVWRRIAEEAARWARALAVDAGAPGAAPRAARAPAPAGSRSAVQRASDTPALGAATVPRGGELAACGLLLAFAYPDRIAQRRPDGRYLLRGGRGATFGDSEPLSKSEYIVCAELDDLGRDGRIDLASSLELGDLLQHFAGDIQVEETVEWDREPQTVKSRRRELLGAIVLKDVPSAKPNPELVTQALLRGIASEGLDMLPWTRNARQLQERLVFLHRLNAVLPDYTDEALLASLAEWLGPHLHGMRCRADLQRLPLAGILHDALPWERRREMDEQAPTHFVVPSGSKLPIDYSDAAAPAVAVRLQEMFGLQETPRLGWGRVPLTLHLLSPASRPVQVTRDLASFWRETYFEVKKDLKGRYPKHYWPDDPLTATATHRVRPRP